MTWSLCCHDVDYNLRFSVDEFSLGTREVMMRMV
jgi:hypothetical protein